MDILPTWATSGAAWVPTSALGVLGLAWCLLAALVLVTLFYRNTIMHMRSPLKSMPQVKGGSFFFGQMATIVRGSTCEPQLKWAKELGPIFTYQRLPGNYVVFNAHPAMIKRVLVTHVKRYPKSAFQTRMMKNVVGSSVLTTEGDEHKKQRSLLNPHFRFENLRSIFPVFVKQANLFADYLATEYMPKGAEIDVHNQMARFTLQVIGLSAFGFNFDSVVNPDSDLFAAYGQLLPTLSPWLVMLSILPALRHLPIEANETRRRSVRTIKNQVMKICNERLKQRDAKARRAAAQQGHGQAQGEAAHSDLLGLMMDGEYKDGTKMTAEELTSQVMTFMIAGHETTSNALCWIFYLLSEHPEVEAELRREVQTVLTSEHTDFGYDLLHSLPYTWAVCMESMRLFPPVPLVDRMCKEGDTWAVDGHTYVIPPRTRIFLSPMVTQRDPTLWEDPESFKPERWFVGGDRSERFKPKPFTFMPFLYGPRACIGQRFAVMEMQVALATLVRRFSFKMVPGQTIKPTLRVTMRPSPSLRMTVHPAPSVAKDGAAAPVAATSVAYHK